MDETKQKFLDKMHPPRAEEQIVSYRKWMLYLFLCAIPIVNIIFLLVFATSKDPSMITMKNFAKAACTWILINVVLVLAFTGIWVFCIASSVT